MHTIEELSPATAGFNRVNSIDSVNYNVNVNAPNLNINTTVNGNTGKMNSIQENNSKIDKSNQSVFLQDYERRTQQKSKREQLAAEDK